MFSPDCIFYCWPQCCVSPNQEFPHQSSYVNHCRQNEHGWIIWHSDWFKKPGGTATQHWQLPQVYRYNAVMIALNHNFSWYIMSWCQGWSQVWIVRGPQRWHGLTELSFLIEQVQGTRIKSTIYVYDNCFALFNYEHRCDTAGQANQVR